MLRMYCSAFLFLFVMSGYADTPEETATKLVKLFERRCYECHDVDNYGKDALPSDLDLTDLSELRKIERLFNKEVPEKSRLYTQVLRDRMPRKRDPLNDAEKKLVLEWINLGRPLAKAKVVRFERPLISERDVAKIIERDLKQFNRFKAKSLRYFTTFNVHNDPLTSDKELKLHRDAVVKLINSLHWERDFVSLKALDKNKVVFRLDISEAGWTAKQWDTIVDRYPYQVVFEDVDERLFKNLGTEVPYIRADWFVKFASRPQIYHRLLDLPDTLQGLERKLSINISANLQTGLALRAGFKGRSIRTGVYSGVSNNNRVIEHHKIDRERDFWISYDFKANTGRKDIFEHPLGPGKNEAFFDHDGGEVIFALPNGLHAYMLVDAAGKRLDVAPQNIVSDPSDPTDTVIRNGVSCFSCHDEGMRNQVDRIFSHVKNDPKKFVDRYKKVINKNRVIAKIENLYGRPEDLKKRLERTKTRYLTALKGASVPWGPIEPISFVSKKFIRPILKLESVAADFGITKEELLRKSERSKFLANLSRRITNGGLTREAYIVAFPRLLRELGQGTFVPLANGTKPTPPIQRKPPRVVSVSAATFRSLLSQARGKPIVLLGIPSLGISSGSKVIKAIKNRVPSDAIVAVLPQRDRRRVATYLGEKGNDLSVTYSNMFSLTVIRGGSSRFKMAESGSGRISDSTINSFAENARLFTK